MVRRFYESCPSGLAALVCAGSGLCVAFCFWPYRTGFLAYFVLVPFVLFSGLGKGRGRYILNTFVFGFAYFSASLYWIALLEREQITLPWLRLPAALVLCLYLSLFMLITGYLARRLTLVRLPFEVSLALAWGAVEYLRALGPLGFPWASIGYSQTPYPAVIQQAALVGTYGISAWIVLINGLVARFIISRRITTLILVVVVFACPVLIGHSIVPQGDAAPTMSLALVQPNISGSVKWDQAYRDSTLELLSDMTTEARGAAMIVWPETAVPFYVKHSAPSLMRIAVLAEYTGSYILVGFPDYEHDQDKTAFYNSVMLISPAGEIAGEYRKIHLVPFGEMIPFEDRIGILQRVDFGEGDFSPGREYTVFDADGKRFAAAICFESIYPDLAREFVRGGARFIVNITNDEWFGPSLGPYQHAQMAIMRAVELRVGLARCANTGISMFVDPYGRVTSRTRLFERRILTGQVASGSGDTPYLEAGRAIEIGLLVAVIVLAFVSYIPGRKRVK
jgi:apolipoprotein N-acyltransferase